MGRWLIDKQKRKYNINYKVVVFIIGLSFVLISEYGKILWDIPILLRENIIGTVIVSTLLGPIWGMGMITISNTIFNNFQIGGEFIVIMFVTKILEAIIIGVINYKKNKKIPRFIITILILSLIIPFIGIMSSVYIYQYTAEAYNFISHIKSSINMYLEFLKMEYFSNLITYILSFIISMPILTIFDKDGSWG